MSTTLTLSTFDAPARPMNVPLPADPPEGGWTFPPTSVTLIAGERDAVLVDTLPTVEDTDALADWITASGKRLTHVFITHGHFDHYLGAARLGARFPEAKIVATAATAASIAEERRTNAYLTTFAPMFADSLAENIAVPEALPDGRLDLEGHDVVGVPAGQSDVADSSYVWLPDLSAAIVGDIAYNGVHMPLFETAQARKSWIATLQEVQSRQPRIVVASHRKPGAANDAASLAETIEYIELGDRLLSADPRPSLAEYVSQMVEAHPARVNVSTAIFTAATQGLQ